MAVVSHLLLWLLCQVFMTLIKYTPQALLNAQRRSTEGWSINNVLLDLAGGLLSFAQVGLNAFARGDISVVTGNPAKLGISLLSVAFDVLFILQHYVWYTADRSTREEAADSLQDASTHDTVCTDSSSSSGSSRQRPLSRRLVAVAVRAANVMRQQ